MARLYLTLLVVPLLAACASSPSVRTPSDPSYLEGLDSEYSIRADQIQTESFTKLIRELPEALVAGNEDLTVVASVFRKGPYLTVDMVVYNHGSEDLELHRSDLYVLDFMGNRLEPVADWKGAENYGLRGRLRKSSEYVYYGGKQLTPRAYGQETQAPPGKSANSDPSEFPLSSLGDAGTDLDMVMEPVEIRHYDMGAPATLVVKPGEKKAYWAYFKADRLTFPLTATVRIDGKRLVFRFDRSKSRPEGRESED